MTNNEMKELLTAKVSPGRVITTISEAVLDTTVLLVVKNPMTHEPMVARAKVLAKNHEMADVLTRCGPGYTEFPYDYPCLAHA